VGARAGLDRCGKSRPHRDSIPGLSSPKQVAIPTTLSQSRQSSIPVNYIIQARRLVAVKGAAGATTCTVMINAKPIRVDQSSLHSLVSIHGLLRLLL